MVCLRLSLTYRILLIEEIKNWYSTATHYAKCDVISGQNKKFKLKYLINKTLDRKSTRTCITVLKVLSRNV